jgi:hypothetical protein
MQVLQSLCAEQATEQVSAAAAAAAAAASSWLPLSKALLSLPSLPPPESITGVVSATADVSA